MFISFYVFCSQHNFSLYLIKAEFELKGKKSHWKLFIQNALFLSHWDYSLLFSQNSPCLSQPFPKRARTNTMSMDIIHKTSIQSLWLWTRGLRTTLRCFGIHTNTLVSSAAFHAGKELNLEKVPISKHSYTREDLRPDKVKELWCHLHLSWLLKQAQMSWSQFFLREVEILGCSEAALLFVCLI